MPTSLVNPKMESALAARVATSVRGRTSRTTTARATPRRALLLRAGIATVLGLLVAAVVSEQRARSAELAEAKRSLLEARSELRSTLTLRANQVGERLNQVVQRESTTYHGSVRDETLRDTARWDSLLSRPLLYARLALDAVQPPERLDAALAESRKDAFVTCLKQPPAGRTEKELMKRVNEVLGAATDDRTLHVYRAHDALVALRVLDPALDRQLERAQELSVVLQLQNLWDQARMTDRLPAAFGEVVVLLLDEAKVPGTPVELDGASVHGVRVVIVDVSGERDQVLWRSHHDLNPGWVSERRRHQYAQALEGCRLAHDLRASLGQAQP